MKKDLIIIKTLKSKGFSNIDIDLVVNYLETLDYDLKSTKYIGNILAKNERLAKYFFLRDQFKMDNYFVDESFHLKEILDECIDWSEFWRLLVIKKGFCCVPLTRKLDSRKRFIFLSGPNILLRSSADFYDSIYDI
tara:strand:- start:149 stop:556 length:408 start_codon:yes stop_codon:yes gene_type:complete